MDILGLLSGALVQVWYIIPLLLIVSVFKSRWFKGLFGEYLVNRLLSQLSESDYTLIKDVTLPTEDGSLAQKLKNNGLKKYIGILPNFRILSIKIINISKLLNHCWV